ncbi:hypothetical protein TASCI_20002 [Tenacibaculum ascidiaceicola]
MKHLYSLKSNVKFTLGFIILLCKTQTSTFKKEVVTKLSKKLQNIFNEFFQSFQTVCGIYSKIYPYKFNVIINHN